MLVYVYSLFRTGFFVGIFNFNHRIFMGLSRSRRNLIQQRRAVVISAMALRYQKMRAKAALEVC